MAPSTLQHRRTHNTLLISKLLNQHGVSSPFTLLLDSLEQSARPVVTEFVRRANVAKVKTVFVAFETLKAPKGVAEFIEAWGLPDERWTKAVAALLKKEPSRRTLLILDTLNPLATASPSTLPAILSTLITPTTSLLATYHTDIPLPFPSQAQSNPYAPSPLTLLGYLATTIFIVHSLHHVLAQKAARERSQVDPIFGLGAGIEGVVVGKGANGERGVVLEMEHRRRSGRGVREWFVLSARTEKGEGKGEVALLEDHPEYRALEKRDGGDDEKTQDDSTFELGLSERQRRDREGVVLPYFDAQKGGGEGGRILYDMGSEDDFDEEEDEI